MTVLVTESASPPSDIIEDAETVADKTVAQRVRVEDAVDDSWILRVEGPTGDSGNIYTMSEQEFEDLSNTVEKLLGGTHESFKTYYRDRDTYLIRIEY